MLNAHERGQFLFKGFAFGSEGKPEIQRGADGGLDFILVEHASGVGDGLAGSPRCMSGIVTGTLPGMHKRRVFAGEAEDFGFEFGG